MIREAITRNIVERDVVGESLREEGVQCDDEPLLVAACDEFDAWHTALEYAGVGVNGDRDPVAGDRGDDGGVL